MRSRNQEFVCILLQLKLREEKHKGEDSPSSKNHENSKILYIDLPPSLIWKSHLQGLAVKSSTENNLKPAT